MRLKLALTLLSTSVDNGEIFDSSKENEKKLAKF